MAQLQDIEVWGVRGHITRKLSYIMYGASKYGIAGQLFLFEIQNGRAQEYDIGIHWLDR